MHPSFKYEVDARELKIRFSVAEPRDEDMDTDSDADSGADTEIENDGTMSWAQYIGNEAVLLCPNAKKETLVQYEIDLGLGTPVEVESMPKLLDAEFNWFDKIKRRNSGGVALTPDDFASFGFSLVLSIMKSVFAQNPILLAELLKLPVRATFTNADNLAALFKYQSKSLINGDKMAKLLTMLRTDLNNTMPIEEYRALLAMQRMEKVRAKDPYADRHSRGHRIGLAALHEPLPLMGQAPGVSVSTANSDKRNAPTPSRRENSTSGVFASSLRSKITRNDNSTSDSSEASESEADDIEPDIPISWVRIYRQVQKFLTPQNIEKENGEFAELTKTKAINYLSQLYGDKTEFYFLEGDLLKTETLRKVKETLRLRLNKILHESKLSKRQKEQQTIKEGTIRKRKLNKKK